MKLIIKQHRLSHFLNTSSKTIEALLKKQAHFLFSFIILFIFGLNGIAFAGSAIVSWGANSESDLAGYKVYNGTSSGSYGSAIDVGNTTNYTFANLSDGSHYFVVTAYDTSGNESGYSIEVSKAISSGGSGGSGASGVKTTDSTPPGDIQDFKATGGDHKISLSWLNPVDGDFVGVRIRYRIDQYPSDINDGILLGDITGEPEAKMSAVHSGLPEVVTYYYLAATYDQNGNYQETVFASAKTNGFSQDNFGLDAGGGGCGIIRPGGGSPPKPGDSAAMLTLTGFIFLILLRKEILKRADPISSRKPSTR